LAGVWRSAPTALTLEWLSALAHASALIAGHDATAVETAAEVVGTALIRTRWVDAAQAVVDGARHVAVGAHQPAAREFAEAVRRYDAIGCASDAALAAAWTARALVAAGAAGAAEPFLSRVRAFAERNRAPGLAHLTD
jgi:hypothetical protein